MTGSGDGIAASPARAADREPQPLADDAAHLLLVDDDRRIRDLLSRILQRNGYRVTLAGTAAEAHTHLRSFAFDLLVLDVMMPGETGIELAETVRKTSEVPILMLTALADADDRVRGLEVGADDYLTKPYEPRELLLRIASILRRATPRQPRPDAATVRFGPFVLAVERGELRQGEEIVRLTDREREMLQMLAATAGATVARDALGGPRRRQRADRGRPGEPAAPQDRARSGQSDLSSNRAGARLSACHRPLTCGASAACCRRSR